MAEVASGARCCASSTMRSGWTGHLAGAGLRDAAALAESVAVLIATREPSEDFSGLPELAVEGRRIATRASCWTPWVPVAVGRVRERIVAETRGNPLALLELPRTANTETVSLPD